MYRITFDPEVIQHLDPVSIPQLIGIKLCINWSAIQHFMTCEVKICRVCKIQSHLSDNVHAASRVLHHFFYEFHFKLKSRLKREFGPF